MADRPLEALYPVIYLAALVVKVKDGAHVRNKHAHIAIWPVRGSARSSGCRCRPRSSGVPGTCMTTSTGCLMPKGVVAQGILIMQLLSLRR